MRIFAVINIYRQVRPFFLGCERAGVKISTRDLRNCSIKLVVFTLLALEPKVKVVQGYNCSQMIANTQNQLTSEPSGQESRTMNRQIVYRIASTYFRAKKNCLPKNIAYNS